MKFRTFLLFFCLVISSIIPAEEIRFLYNRNYYPFEFTNEQGKADGFVIDVLFALAREAAYEITFIPGNWKQREEDLYNGDGYFTTGFLNHSSHDSIITSKILFSLPFSLIYRSGISPHSLKDLDGRTPLFSSGDSSEQVLYTYLKPEKVIRTKSWSDAVKALDTGYGDFAIISRIQKDLIIGEYHEKLSVMEEFHLVLPYVIYTTRWDKEKLEKLNNSLSIIRASGEFDRITGKWFAEENPLITASGKKRSLLYLIPAAIACIILLTIYKKRKVRL
ncbi:substrate-binding periplasmic protein [Spirochaeta isovalerica]|uniref:ABC-type amino acid transport substrate-binding protein n=1 Tax=Spirochaeta isovalerica TaxID=150 RepID=A0A841RGQ3_9SPIO|nr:transporter substrate-binding domain-containing protein [Spirochaeta isovalerica]MBB6481688.1 ABC-type amino acid transport substrate-binding protein [Spirochaeta isovalerica]